VDLLNTVVKVLVNRRLECQAVLAAWWSIGLYEFGCEYESKSGKATM
jgi:hypothetical protein